MGFVEFVLAGLAVWALLDVAGHLGDISDSLEKLTTLVEEVE